MAQVQRGNVFLEIPDEDINKYMAKGFSVVDARGNIIKQCMPTELTQLQRAYTEHEEIIKQLNSEIALLKIQLAEAKASAAPTGDVASAGEAPKRRRKAQA